jgi:hypothetical protein
LHFVASVVWAYRSKSVLGAAADARATGNSGSNGVAASATPSRAMKLRREV